MSTQYPDLFAALAAPFAPHEEKRFEAKGRPMVYVTARTVMNRLDEVCGPENWRDAYRPAGEHSVICALTIRLDDGRELTKEDAGGSAGMADSGDDDKSMFSDAFKRAAVKWGISRYLYRDGVPNFLGVLDPAATTAPKSTPVHSNPHQSTPPAKARHDWGPRAHGAVDPARTANGNGNGYGQDFHMGTLPRTGKGLFSWVKREEERRGEPGLLRRLNGWAKGQGLPGRMVEWSDDQVELALIEMGFRPVENAGRGDAYEEEPATG